MNVKTKFNVLVAVVLLAVLCFNIASFAADCAQVRRDVLRLHVVAASDSRTISGSIHASPAAI